MTPDDPRHGTTTGYGQHRCRCDRCRAANTAAHTRWRRSVGILPRWIWVEAQKATRKHGIGSYNKGCRCDQCRKAAREARARHRRKDAA